MHKKRFRDITTQFSHKKVLVVGDLMLDTYVWGQSDRISPEAPVPVIHINKVEHRPGGAANVALNLSSLGCDVTIIGVIGSDSEGKILVDRLNQQKITCTSVVVSNQRPTTVKSRIMAQNQHVVRTDRESNNDLSEKSNTMILDAVSQNLDKVDAIILQDYNKGVLNKFSIESLVQISNNKAKPIYVDPKKDNFNRYKNIRLFKPNLIEFQTAIGEAGSIEMAGFKLKNKINAELLLITRGADGVSLFKESDYHKIPTQARLVHDVSGAGDTVIATFTLSDLCGASPEESAVLSNYAAGRVCEEAGVVNITMKMLNEMFEHHNSI